MVEEAMVHAAARADAAYAGRTFDALGAADKTRFKERATLMLEAALSAAEPQPAPSVAVKDWNAEIKKLREYRQLTYNTGFLHLADWMEDMACALSALVQDVAEPDFLYRIEYDYRSYVEKKTMWGLYRELGVVALEEAQEALQIVQQNNAGNFRISRKPVVKWEPLTAAPAKQEGGGDVTSK